MRGAHSGAPFCAFPICLSLGSRANSAPTDLRGHTGAPNNAKRIITSPSSVGGDSTPCPPTNLRSLGVYNGLVTCCTTLSVQISGSKTADTDG